MSYDKNGNILTLTRTGDLDNSIFTIEIDDLEYEYDNGNRLKKVTDYTNHPEGFTDGADNNEEYVYDLYGNMVRDDNKGIAQITYNHLNLPKEISFSGTPTRNISYIYNALGQKVSKSVTYGVSYTTTDYLGGFHYENEVLKFFATAEGYVNVLTKGNKTAYNYVYNYTDHLGNIRVSYTENDGEAEILEENHYYPFGLKHKKYGSVDKQLVNIVKGQAYYVGVETVPPGARKTYQYKYNGKEFQDELNLNLYDYGARNYQPDLGRWLNIDPLAEQYRRWSPYNYVMNSPLRFVDPDGRSVNKVIITGTDADRATKALNKSTNLKITRDSKTGELSAKGEAKTDYDKALLAAINDDKINVNLKANSVKKIAVDGKVADITIGAYGGSQKIDGKIEALQMINMNQADKVEKAGIMPSGNIVGHEVIESHIAAQENDGDIRAYSKEGDAAYDKAHKEAARLDPKFVELQSVESLLNSQLLLFDNGKTVIID